MTMKKLIYVRQIILSTVFVCTIAGCGSSRQSVYILAQSSVTDITRGSNNTAEVTKTPRYSGMVSKVKSVALTAPSSCANQTASSATGSAENKGTIVMTRCGVELAEIERALIRQGFTVYSWKAVDNAVNANKTMSAAAAAKQLGAQVLFQINSLERVKIIPGRDAQIERTYFASNSSGAILNRMELNEQRINEIKAVTKDDEDKQIPSAIRQGAMLDINAVDSETGQAIWFYRWSKNENALKGAFASYLVQCWDGWGCRNETIGGQDNQQKTPEKRSKDVETVSTDAQPTNIENAKYFGLLRDVTDDFVRRFSSGV